MFMKPCVYIYMFIRICCLLLLPTFELNKIKLILGMLTNIYLAYLDNYASYPRA